MTRTSLLWVLSLAAAPSVVEAASFDCKKVSSQPEKTICASPTLSSAQERLDHVYRADLARLSATGAAAIEASQRDWFESLDAGCAPAPEGSFEGVLPYNQCLALAFEERQRQLDEAVETFGRITVYEVDDRVVSTVHGDRLFSTVDYPQIDHPTTEAVEAWNASMVAKPASTSPCDSGAGNYERSSRVDFATAHLASVLRVESFYCWGTPHGTGDADAMNVGFDPRPHRLQAVDLFKPGTGWERFLVSRFVEQTRAAFGPDVAKIEPPDDFTPEQIVAREALQPSRWILSREGLRLLVEPYELGLGRAADPDAHASWSELAAYLEPDLGLPPT